MARPQPKCPIRTGDPRNLCVPGASGPQDCGLVCLVKSDPELAEELLAGRQELAAEVAAQSER